MHERPEPPNDGMTDERYGQQFARDTLLQRIDGVEVGDTVECDYQTKSGLEVSKVGTVVGIERTEHSVDFRIRTGGPTDTCYLHVNTDTKDVFFGDDSRHVGDRTLLWFDPK